MENLKNYLSDVKLGMLHCCKTGKLKELFIRCKIVALLHCCIVALLQNKKLKELFIRYKIVALLQSGKLEELFLRLKIVALLQD